MKGYKIDISGEEKELIVTCEDCTIYPSIEDNELCMKKVIDFLIEVGNVTSITIKSDRNYVYPYEQVELLNEVASCFIVLIKEKEILNKEGISKRGYNIIVKFLNLYKKDPLGAYLFAKRFYRKEKVSKEKDEELLRRLKIILEEMEKLKIVNKVKEKLPGYKIGDRSLYRELFMPLIRPNFIYTRLMLEIPLNAEQIDSYKIGKMPVRIFKVKDKISYLYHVVPEEFNLSVDEYRILDEARNILSKYKPEKREFIEPKRLREVFFKLGIDTINEVCKRKGIKIKYEKVKKLAKILVRLTVGFGIIEKLLEDEDIEDVYINAPIGYTPIFVKHSKYGECHTNILPNFKEAEAWVSRFRLYSGRPLDEANPVLDTELFFKNVRARVSIIQRPLSPKGYSFAFRRHRARPWTLPLFIRNKFLTPLAAGLLWFLVDGSRTLLIAGTRGSGKTSLLGALIGEILRKYRIITIEDTLELPTSYYREIGYDILPMKVRSAITYEKGELSAEEGIRVSLRLGDSCLIIGEVRSKEAIALYEAMRVGALANVVAGTIHGESPYGVFDRVVNDLKVPRTSFKATDIIVMANKIRSADMLHEYRRVVQITEVRKHWEEDPLKEKGFYDLMLYDAKEDKIKPTPGLVHGESEVIKAIASRVREFAGNWDRVWENIVLRSKVKEMLVNYANKLRNYEILEANFNIKANEKFHEIVENKIKEVGYPESKEVLEEFEAWLKKEVKKWK